MKFYLEIYIFFNKRDNLGLAWVDHCEFGELVQVTTAGESFLLASLPPAHLNFFQTVISAISQVSKEELTAKWFIAGRLMVVDSIRKAKGPVSKAASKGHNVYVKHSVHIWRFHPTPGNTCANHQRVIPHLISCYYKFKKSLPSIFSNVIFSHCNAMVRFLLVPGSPALIGKLCHRSIPEIWVEGETKRILQGAHHPSPWQGSRSVWDKFTLINAPSIFSMGATVQEFL